MPRNYITLENEVSTKKSMYEYEHVPGCRKALEEYEVCQVPTVVPIFRGTTESTIASAIPAGPRIPHFV